MLSVPFCLETSLVWTGRCTIWWSWRHKQSGQNEAIYLQGVWCKFSQTSSSEAAYAEPFCWGATVSWIEMHFFFCLRSSNLYTFSLLRCFHSLFTKNIFCLLMPVSLSLYCFSVDSCGKQIYAWVEYLFNHFLQFIFQTAVILF